jgi:hypothetical protein
VADFFKQSEEIIHSKGINAHINSTTKDLSLKIGSKRSNRSAKSYDVGQKGKFLKFEMEIRRKLIGDYIKSEKYQLSAISIKHFLMFLKFTKNLNYDI